MREITVSLTEKQEKFLKLFAANHYPGTRDNLATNRPIHIVQTKILHYIPYNQDVTGYYEHLSLVFGCNEFDCPMSWIKDETELVKHYYDARDEEPPFPIKPFNELQYTRVPGKNGEDIWVDDYQDYFTAYGIHLVSMAWEKEHYKDVAFFFILKEAKNYIHYQGHNLKEPRTYSDSPGYSNQGEYEHFYDLLLRMGQKLNETAETA